MTPTVITCITLLACAAAATATAQATFIRVRSTTREPTRLETATVFLGFTIGIAAIGAATGLLGGIVADAAAGIEHTSRPATPQHAQQQQQHQQEMRAHELPPTRSDDDPSFDCRTDGNHACGPIPSPHGDRPGTAAWPL